jgi:predicted enzyme related to lactoylglutathione lyase
MSFESGGAAPFVPVKAETAMTESHGRFVWYELTTTNMAATRAFYTEVVGWGARNASMAGLPYTVFTAWDDPVSGMMELPKAARNRGERPMWIGYVYVDDIDAVADRVKRLGGAVHLPPQDVLHVSRFSVVSDPQMAIFALFKWQSAGQIQSVNRLSLGCVGWHELLAADHEQAWDFYSELFGWQKARTNVSSVGLYQQFSIAGETIGGMMTKPPTVPTCCWLYYFNVGDIDAAIKRVTAAGGQVLGGPMEAPDGNWIAQCADPQGAIFALVGRRGFGYFKRTDVQRIVEGHPNEIARKDIKGVRPPMATPGACRDALQRLEIFEQRHLLNRQVGAEVVAAVVAPLYPRAQAPRSQTCKARRPPEPPPSTVTVTISSSKDTSTSRQSKSAQFTAPPISDRFSTASARISSTAV